MSLKKHILYFLDNGIHCSAFRLKIRKIEDEIASLHTHIKPTLGYRTWSSLCMFG